MQINQVNISYAPIEDRLLVRVNTTGGAELRLWLTRTLVMKIMPVMSKAEVQLFAPTVQHITNPAVRSATEQFHVEETLAKSDFNSQFADKAASYPLGELPLLVAGVEVRMNGDSAALAFTLVDNRVMTINLNSQLLAGVNKLLVDVVKGTNWNSGADGVKRPTITMPETEVWH